MIKIPVKEEEERESQKFGSEGKTRDITQAYDGKKERVDSYKDLLEFSNISHE